MPTTPLPPGAKALRAKLRVNNPVSKTGTRMIYDFLTGCPQDMDTLFNQLCATFSSVEADTPPTKRPHLKLWLASVWECARYGWVCAVWLHEDRIGLIKLATPSRRLRCLCRQAIDCGRRIARQQAGDI